MITWNVGTNNIWGPLKDNSFPEITGAYTKIWARYIYTANVLAVNSTFYFCVKNPPTVSCDFSRYLSVVYQDQYSALFTEK